MSILRHEISGNFTVIPNSLWSADMTMQAKAVVGCLLSKPDHWDVRTEVMAREFKVGREAMKNALRSAQEAGWLYRYRQQRPDGTWEVITVVRDAPLATVPEIDGQGCQDITGHGETRRPVTPGPGSALDVSKDGTATTDQQEGRKKTSSPSSSRTRSPRSSRGQVDDGPDQSTLDDINRGLTPDRVPATTGRGRRRSPTRHVHRPKKDTAGGLACYWCVETAKHSGGSLEPNEEAIVGSHFKRWLDKDASPEVLRAMVDLFFADPEMAGSTHRWKRFVANAESLRQRVAQQPRSRTAGRANEFVTKLPEEVRRRIEREAEDVA